MASVVDWHMDFAAVADLADVDRRDLNVAVLALAEKSEPLEMVSWNAGCHCLEEAAMAPLVVDQEIQEATCDGYVDSILGHLVPASGFPKEVERSVREHEQPPPSRASEAARQVHCWTHASSTIFLNLNQSSASRTVLEIVTAESMAGQRTAHASYLESTVRRWRASTIVSLAKPLFEKQMAYYPVLEAWGHHHHQCSTRRAHSTS
jgi:hypothetical protein